MKKLFVAFGLLSAAGFASAADLPSAGSQLQQIPAMPSAAPPAPGFALAAPETPRATAPADDLTFHVKGLRIDGARAFSARALLDAAAFRPGEVRLADLHAAAAAIAAHYRSAGYFLAQADVPAQDLVDGVVTIAVNEGRYGGIELRNSSRVSSAVARRVLDGLHSGDAVTIRPLESRLLQLADVPGVVVKSTLAPGLASGAADLIVEMTPGRRVTGSLEADNSGSRHTGANRVGGSLQLNNPTGHGDVATLRALTSGSGLAYGRVGYQASVGRARAGAAYTALDYELGGQFRALDAHGTARIATLHGSYPLLRGRDSSLHASLALDSKRFDDVIGVTDPAMTTRKRARAASFTLSGEHHDDFGGGGMSTFALDWTSGILDIDSAAARQVDAVTARTDGRYDKAGLSVQRLQRVSEWVTCYARLQGQAAGGNLDVSEKLSLGGAGAVRAYPEGEAYVDEGYLLSIEARVSMDGLLPRLPGALQWVTFLESAAGSSNRDPWADGRNHRRLSGGGAGLAFREPHGLHLEAYYAHTLGDTDDTSTPNGDGRVWVRASRQF